MPHEVVGHLAEVLGDDDGAGQLGERVGSGGPDGVDEVVEPHVGDEWRASRHAVNACVRQLMVDVGVPNSTGTARESGVSPGGALL